MGKNHIIKKHFKNFDYKMKNFTFLLDVEQKQGEKTPKIHFLLHILKFNDLSRKDL